MRQLGVGFFAYWSAAGFFVEIFRGNHNSGEGIFQHERSYGCMKYRHLEVVTQVRLGSGIPGTVKCDDTGASRKANAMGMDYFPCGTGEITC